MSLSCGTAVSQRGRNCSARNRGPSGEGSIAACLGTTVLEQVRMSEAQK